MLIDNKNTFLKDSLIKKIEKGSAITIASASFSMYAYKELKEQLEEIEELKFLFTSKTFSTDSSAPEKREFYIPKLMRERTLYGSEFEIKLRNEMTLKSIARECADWIKRKVKFKTNQSNTSNTGFINIKDVNIYYPISDFTTVSLGVSPSNEFCSQIMELPPTDTKTFMDNFMEIWQDPDKSEDVTEKIIDCITKVYEENSPEFIYYLAIFNIFQDFLEDTQDFLAQEGTGFKESKIWNMLYDFQRDAVLSVINKIEKYNGCILADSVGLGKTFTALGVIKYYEAKNRNVLVLCPKKLNDNWNTYKENYLNNPLAGDKLNYDVLYHTDLLRQRGLSNGKDLAKYNWKNNDLIVIDESHNFRNGLDGLHEDKDNRYSMLLNKVINSGIKSRVLLLSATPVNNSFNDLKNQLQLIYELNADKLGMKKSYEAILSKAQKAFNRWTKFTPEEKVQTPIKDLLDLDFYRLLDTLTIARSRKHIKTFYDMTKIGAFPKRKKPKRVTTDISNFSEINFKTIFPYLRKLNLEVYTPSKYFYEEFVDQTVNEDTNLKITEQEFGLKTLMLINIVKRLESSIYSFNKTLVRIREYIDRVIEYTEKETNKSIIIDIDPDIIDGEDEEDIKNIPIRSEINLEEIDTVKWLGRLREDRENLTHLIDLIDLVKPKDDTKLQTLKDIIIDKINNPINPGNKKLLIFTAFSDTANYLYDNISKFAKEELGLETGLVTGGNCSKLTFKGVDVNYNNILTLFSPKSKDKDVLLPGCKKEISVLIGTDCISEGQNLQDCDVVVNYDIQWNPVRIIQRFGRIDRIGSVNEYVQMINFLPNMDIDNFLNLTDRVRSRMEIVDITATGDDNILKDISQESQFRNDQIKRMLDEPVDIEDVSGQVSLTDLGLNEYRMDVAEADKIYKDMVKMPFGMHAVVPATETTPPGIIFILKNTERGINKYSQNLIHPYYLVYVKSDGEVLCNHLNPKDTLEAMRYLCKGKKEPYKDLCKVFNKETKDGKNMSGQSKLLKKAVESIVNVHEEKNLSLFLNGGVPNFTGEIKGLDDFELICFLVVK